MTTTMMTTTTNEAIAAPASPAQPEEGPVSLEVVSLMSAYWEPHFLFKVFDWMEGLGKNKGISAEVVLRGRLAVLESTRMIEKTRETKQQLGLPVESEEDLQANLAQQEAEVSALEASLISFKAALLAYRKSGDRNMTGATEKIHSHALSDWWQKQKPKPNDSAVAAGDVVVVPEEPSNCHRYDPFPRTVDANILQLAKLLFSMGRYTDAKRHLDFYLQVVSEVTYEGFEIAKRQSVSWGIAAIVILCHPETLPDSETVQKEEEVEIRAADKSDAGDVDDLRRHDPGQNECKLDADIACRCILRLYDFLEAAPPSVSTAAVSASSTSGVSNSRELLMLQKSWLLHWAIWPFFRYHAVMAYTKGHTPRANIWGVVPEWLMQENNLAVVHLVCPHLFRYYAVYAILNRTRRDHCQTIVAAISQSQSKYSDAFTRLLEALFVNFDFDAAQQNMGEVAQCCETDFFLAPLKSVIEETARLLIFEIYCRIHRSINIDMIAKKLNMPADVAERWIVNLIRHAKLEAKIDSEKNRVEMCGSAPNLYQQVIEKTRSLCNRTNMVYVNRQLTGTFGDRNGFGGQQGFGGIMGGGGSEGRGGRGGWMGRDGGGRGGRFPRGGGRGGGRSTRFMDE